MRVHRVGGSMGLHANSSAQEHHRETSSQGLRIRLRSTYIHVRVTQQQKISIGRSSATPRVSSKFTFYAAFRMTPQTGRAAVERKTGGPRGSLQGQRITNASHESCDGPTMPLREYLGLNESGQLHNVKAQHGQVLAGQKLTGFPCGTATQLWQAFTTVDMSLDAYLLSGKISQPNRAWAENGVHTQHQLGHTHCDNRIQPPLAAPKVLSGQIQQ